MKERIPVENEGEPVEAAPPAPPQHAVLALQRTAGNRAVSAMLARTPGADPPPLLLTDRPWSEIEREIEERNRRLFLGELPELPLSIELPEPAPPPTPVLLLDSVPWDERERLNRNRQQATGQYKDPVGEYGDDAAAAPADAQKLLLQSVKAQGVKEVARLDATDKEDAGFKRLMAAARAANQALEKGSGDYQAAIEAVQAVIAWVGPYLIRKAERRTTRVKDNHKFSDQVGAKAKAVEEAAERENRKSDKRSRLTTIFRALTTLQNETYTPGASPADRERFKQMSDDADAIIKGVVKPVAAATPTVDPDEDGRTGTEPTLTYRGGTYHLIPGGPAKVYGRIDPAMRLIDIVNDEYMGALKEGFVPTTGINDKGVKDKPKYYELKLIKKQARRIGVGETTRIITSNRDGLYQASKGIRYLTFDKWHEAHL